jgi:RNA methyltransferase, TrmH family
MEQYKPYKKDFDYSYTLGAFPTFEAINKKPDCVREVFCDDSFTEKDKLYKLCSEKKIPLTVNNKQVSKLSDKENVFVTAIINKFTCSLDENRSHIVLVNPSNMGNLGTIMRTSLAFSIHDCAIISPGADMFNPKVIRASMGAVFSLRTQYFNEFDEYRSKNTRHEIFTFMLNGKKTLSAMDCPKPSLFSLVFGNEATGLDDRYLDYGTSIIIPESSEVDSLNITIAAGIGMFLFSNASQNLQKQ